MKLSPDMQLIYWQRYGQALDLLNEITIHYHRSTVVNQLFTFFSKFTHPNYQPLDPLQFIEEIRKLCGPQFSPPVKSITQKPNTNNTIKKRRWKHWNQAENCDHCKVRNCKNEKHNIYWKKKAIFYS